MKLSRVHRRQWRWRFEARRNDVWGVLADTARLNEAAGLGKHVVTVLTRPDGSVEHRGKTRFGVWSLEWRRHQTDWVAGKGFLQRTEFLVGPLKALTFSLNLLEEGQSTVCDYEIEIEAGSLLGVALSPLIARRLKRSYQSLRAPVTQRFRGSGDRIPMTFSVCWRCQGPAALKASR